MPSIRILLQGLLTIVWTMKSPVLGMTIFKGNYMTKDDAKVVKNYLSKVELQRLNLLVFGFLDFAKFPGIGNGAHSYERLDKSLR